MNKKLRTFQRSSCFLSHMFIPGIALLAIWTPNVFAVTYSVTDLTSYFSPFGGGARAVNNLGQVVGTGSSAAILDGGDFTLLTPLGRNPSHYSSFASDINDQGQVVGSSSSSAGQVAILWENGIAVSLGSLGGNLSFATAINANGDIAGGSQTTFSADDRARHAFLWVDGVMSDLGTLYGDVAFSEARSLNNNRQVVGLSRQGSDPYSPFLWENGLMTELPTLYGKGKYDQAIDINDLGQIVGYDDIGFNGYTNSGAALLWENGVPTDLGSLGGSRAGAIAINNFSQIVGFSATMSGSNHAYIWDNGVMTDLNDLVADIGDLVLTNAININDIGQIITYGNPDGFGDTGMYLLTPNPESVSEPTTLTLMAFGLVGLGWRRYRLH